MCDRLIVAREKVRRETAAKIAALEHLRHADRLKTGGEVASGIAHEFGSPLNVISARAKLICTGNLTESERQRNADVIHQVLANLITNAIQAMPNGGSVEISVHRRCKPPLEDDRAHDGEYVCLCVGDEGEGISEENIGRVFEPFFTTKDVGEGTGLGLSVAYGIVREHGGWIDVQSEQGKGSRFFVCLPVAGSR